MAYIYEPLSEAGEAGDLEIRVAVLQPSSSFHAELQIELIVTPLWIEDSDSDDTYDEEFSGDEFDDDGFDDDGLTGDKSRGDEPSDENIDTNHVQIDFEDQWDESSDFRIDEPTARGAEHADADCSTSKTPSTKFEALSYVWGSQDDPSYARVLSGTHSGTLPITRNLDVALRHLRQPTEVRYIWIDALCINQGDLIEKSGQVRSMHHVFMAATRTIAWLGPEANDSDIAIRDLQGVYDRLSTQPNHSQGREMALNIKEQVSKSTCFDRVLDQGEDIIADAMPELEESVPWRDKALKEWQPSEISRAYFLLSRPYFERAWIQQEIHFSESVSFQCGDSTISEEVLWKVVTHLLPQLWNMSIQQTVACSDWKRALDRIWRISTIKLYRKGLRLVNIRYFLREVKCQDPRDRLFSVSSMLYRHDRFIFADYTKPVEGTYRKVAQFSIECYRSLEILRCCELSTRVLQIPSWVPDWSTSPLYGHHPPLAWSACAFISARRYPIESELHCPASGVRIDRVSKVVAHSINWHEGRHDLYKDIARHLISVLKFLCAIEPSEEVLASPYRTGESVCEAYCRLLTWDQLRDKQPPWGFTEAFKNGLAQLSQIWFSDFTTVEDYYETWTEEDGMNHKVLTMTQGKHFIETENGYIGWAPIGTEVGDTVCVLLGSNVPLILRPATDSDDRDWLVVGPAYVHGLMYGEAIYRGRLSQQYAFGSTKGLDLEAIDYLQVGYQVANEATVEADPVVLLEQAGIEVESYERYPHNLVVRESSLRAAGIPIEVFRLV